MTEAVENKGVLYEFGQYVLDPDERVLFANGQPVHLTDKVFDTLLYFLQNNGRLLTKEELMNSLWAESFVEESNLAKNISRLRKILNTGDAPLIETLPRRGYRFLGDVREIDAGTSVVVRRDVRVRIAHSVERPDDIEPQTNGRLYGRDERLVLNPAPRHSRFRKWGLPVAAIAVVAIGSILFAGFYSATDRAAVKRDEAGHLRLTNNPKHDISPAWTHDGRIRFARWNEGEDAQSLVMGADGTGQTVVKDFRDFAFGSWSPDERKVLFGKPGVRGRMYLADPDGSNEIGLPPGGNHHWSADSQMIVYQAKSERGDDDIFIYSLDSGEIKNVTQAPSFDADPSFSPDGKQIVFSSVRDGNLEVYLMNIDGSDIRRLTNHPAWDGHPVFSPDGTTIAYTSNPIDENSDVYLMNLDGSNVRRLTDWPSDEGIGPGGWSPDGTQIAYTSSRDGNDDIYIKSAEAYLPRLIIADGDVDLSFAGYSPDGEHIIYQASLADKTGELRIFDVQSNQTRTLLKTQNADPQPVFSPDGEHIAFQKKIDTNTEICLINAEGSGLTNLTANEARDANPSFSPDGRKLAFTSNRSGNYGHYTLFTMNLDGSETREIFATQWGMSLNPTWSTDGSEILFTNDKEDGNIGNFEIFKIDLRSPEELIRLTARPKGDGYPSMSPDGKRVAYVSHGDGNPEIYVMDSDGGHQLRITRNKARDFFPRWSPDGRRLIFASDRGGKYAIYEIEIGN